MFSYMTLCGSEISHIFSPSEYFLQQFVININDCDALIHRHVYDALLLPLQNHHLQ